MNYLNKSSQQFMQVQYKILLVQEAVKMPGESVLVLCIDLLAVIPMCRLAGEERGDQEFNELTVSIVPEPLLEVT